MEKKAGNVGAQEWFKQYFCSTENVDIRLILAKVELWVMFGDVGLSLGVLRCPQESQSSPFSLHEGVSGEELHVSISNMRPLIWTLFFLSNKSTNLQIFKGCCND